MHIHSHCILYSEVSYGVKKKPVLPKSSYNPDFSPADFFLSPEYKFSLRHINLKGQRK
jgi:hypothetical protein